MQVLRPGRKSRPDRKVNLYKVLRPRPLKSLGLAVFLEGEPLPNAVKIAPKAAKHHKNTCETCLRAAEGPQRAAGGPKRAAEVPRTGQGARQHGPQEAKTHVKMQVLRQGRKVDLFARAISTAYLHAFATATLEILRFGGTFRRSTSAKCSQNRSGGAKTL